MKKKYYCEYCDKSFHDNPTTRRSHLNGLQHMTLYRLHYAPYTDSGKVSKAISNKIPCRNLKKDGFCRYGPLCRYSHIDPVVTAISESGAHDNIQSPATSRIQQVVEEIPTVDKWLQRRRQRLGDTQSSSPEYSLPDSLKPYKDNLPPSLIPP